MSAPPAYTPPTGSDAVSNASSPAAGNANTGPTGNVVQPGGPAAALDRLGCGGMVPTRIVNNVIDDRGKLITDWLLGGHDINGLFTATLMGWDQWPARGPGFDFRSPRTELVLMRRMFAAIPAPMESHILLIEGSVATLDCATCRSLSNNETRIDPEL